MAADDKKVFSHQELAIPPWQEQSISPKALSPWGSQAIVQMYDTFSATEKFQSKADTLWHEGDAQAHLRVRIYEVAGNVQNKNIKKFMFQVRMGPHSHVHCVCVCVCVHVFYV